MVKLTAEQRLFRKIRVDESGCLIWEGSIRPDGYGAFSYKGKNHLAHRFVYTRVKGTIPEGLTIDHLCRVRHCVNPNHLEAVTNRENLIRGSGFPAINSKKTHCPKGHPYSPENTLISRRGSRLCRTCHKVYDRFYRARKKAEQS